MAVGDLTCLLRNSGDGVSRASSWRSVTRLRSLESSLALKGPALAAEALSKGRWMRD